MTEFGEPLLNTGPLTSPPGGFPFDQDSPLRLYTEPAAFFTVPTIATQAVMLDEIAAAVTVESHFLEHPYGRWIGTSNKGLTITLDELPATLNAMVDIFRYHKTIQGESGGVKFDANDAEAQTWVLKCAYDGIRTTSERWAPKPLDDEQLAGLWQDIRSFGLAFGIPSIVIPKSQADLAKYQADMIGSGRLLRTDVSRKLINTIFTFSSLKAPRPIARFGQAIIKGSIPPELFELLENDGVTTLTQIDKHVNHSVDWFMQHTYAKLPKSTREHVIPNALIVRRKLSKLLGRAAATGQLLNQNATT